ncbi:MAG: winged helix-turn-helix domain-containing protein [Planctomycetota bacterium]
MTPERIGEAAGALWRRLHAKGGEGVSLSELRKLPGFTPDEAIAGIGWLAREGKLCFRTNGKRGTVVSLVGEEVLASV